MRSHRKCVAAKSETCLVLRLYLQLPTDLSFRPTNGSGETPVFCCFHGHTCLQPRARFAAADRYLFKSVQRIPLTSSVAESPMKYRGFSAPVGRSK